VLPRVTKRYARSSKLSCTNNLKQIGLAYRQWAIDNGEKFPAMVSTANGGAKEWIEAGMVYTSFLVISNELSTPKILICPFDERKTTVTATTFGSPSSLWIPLTNNHSVNYVVGLDADEAQPNTILSGDDNFTVAGAKPEAGVLMLWTNRPLAWTKERHVNEGNIGLGRRLGNGSHQSDVEEGVGEHWRRDKPLGASLSVRWLPRCFYHTWLGPYPVFRVFVAGIASGKSALRIDSG